MTEALDTTREALREALRLVKQARAQLFKHDDCLHPDSPELLAWENEHAGCERCQELLWGYENEHGDIEPSDNLNSSLYDAELVIERALIEAAIQQIDKRRGAPGCL